MNATEFRKRFRGIMSATITPFKANGSINFDAFSPIVDYMLKRGVTTFAVGSTTGEGSALSDEEFKAVVKTYIDVVGSRALVVPAIAHPVEETTVDMLQYSKDVGAAGVMLMCPYYYVLTQEAVFQYYQRMHRLVDIPIVLYNHPMATQFNIGVETQGRLYKLKNIVGIKESNGDLNRFGLEMDLYGKQANITGAAEMVAVYLMMLGTPGFLSPSSNVFPHILKQMFEAVQKKQMTKAMSIFKRFWRYRMLFVDKMRLTPFPAYIKAAMEIVGLPAGLPRKPLFRISRKEITELKALMKREKLV